jgi:hypothetical protein
MRKFQRFGLLVLLSLGIVVVAAGSFRIHYVYMMYFGSRTPDRTWNGYSAYLAGSLEFELGVVR